MERDDPSGLPGVQAVACAFAAALDRDDFPAAGALIALEAEYASPDGPLSGRDAILASYAEHSAWALAHLEQVLYSSEVAPADGGSAVVTFVDDLVIRGGLRHTYRCRQVVTLGADGLISRIVHQDIPGEREALHAFFRAGGLRV